MVMLTEPGAVGAGPATGPQPAAHSARNKPQAIQYDGRLTPFATRSGRRTRQTALSRWYNFGRTRWTATRLLRLGQGASDRQLAIADGNIRHLEPGVARAGILSDQIVDIRCQRVAQGGRNGHGPDVGIVDGHRHGACGG